MWQCTLVLRSVLFCFFYKALEWIGGKCSQFIASIFQCLFHFHFHSKLQVCLYIWAKSLLYKMSLQTPVSRYKAESKKHMWVVNVCTRTVVDCGEWEAEPGSWGIVDISEVCYCGELWKGWKKLSKSQAFFWLVHLSVLGPQLREQRASCHEAFTQEENKQKAHVLQVHVVAC